MSNKKRGSIALARSLCYEIRGAADDSDDMDGGGYGSVEIAEILSAEVVRLQKALAQPVQEPVACRFCFSKKGCRTWQCYDCGEIDDVLPSISNLPVQPEPPQYSFKAHWTDDKRIGVVACVTRPDGGVHLMQTIIDLPPKLRSKNEDHN